MNLQVLSNWCNRERIFVSISIGALALGAIFPWYRLPQEALDIFDTNLFLADIGRFFSAIFVLIALVSTLIIGIRHTPRLPFWVGLLISLFFPYLLTTWSPTVYFLADSYYRQLSNVTQQVEMNFPEVQAQWKQNLSLQLSAPQDSILGLKINDFSFFQIPSWDQFLIEGFGYSNGFFAFMGRGWGFNITGFVIILLGLYLSLGQNRFSSFIQDIKSITPLVLLGVSIFCISVVSVNTINNHLDEMLAKGMYQQVVSESQNLATFYPRFQGDKDFLERLAKAGFYGNEPEKSLILFTQGLENYRIKNFLAAANYFQKSLDIEPKRFLVRGYLAKSLLNIGIEKFNNHQPGAAADRFEEVLRIYPEHVEALYGLMSARIVNNEFDSSVLVAKKIIESQKYFQLPSLALLGQAYLHSSWASYRNNDIEKAWKEYRKSINKSAWK